MLIILNHTGSFILLIHFLLIEERIINTSRTIHYSFTSQLADSRKNPFESGYQYEEISTNLNREELIGN